MKTGALLAVIIFSLVSVAHLLRIVLSAQITIENWSAPMWISYAGVIVPLAVVALLVRESR